MHIPYVRACSCLSLGTGTFGRVYLVRHRPTNKYYAMKTLKKTEVVRLKQVEHINSEKQILSSIKHPFIVNLYVSSSMFVHAH